MARAVSLALTTSFGGQQRAHPLDLSGDVGDKRRRWSTRNALVLRARHVGKKVWVEVAVRKDGHAEVSDTSRKVGPVRAA